MTKEEYGRDENAVPAKDTTLSHVGDIIFSPLGTPRAGTLVCDGSAVSRQTYKELFDFLGVSCGEGDGETTFNLPDLRDVWILCAGTEHEAGESVAEGLPNIEGTFVLWGNPKTGCFYDATTFNFIDVGSSGGYDCARGQCGFDASRSSAIYGASDHVTPKSAVLTPCIIYE